MKYVFCLLVLFFAASGAYASSDSLPVWTSQFEVVATHVGAMNPDEFTAFVTQADAAVQTDAPHARVEELKTYGFFKLILVILFGGFLLNLTPCVFPLIPLNAALLTHMQDAAPEKRRLHGWIAGACYGGGITIAYGLLGLASLFFGTVFGALNGSPLFNYAIGILFLVLGAATLNIFGFSIDFSRYGTMLRKIKSGRYPAAFALGVLTALLAGACVAPVVLSVLLLTADLCAQGNYAALVYPFLLGLGMGIPWVFLGAGFSFLPKSGKWNVVTKYVFALIIVGAGAYYIYQGVKLHNNASSQPAAQDASARLFEQARAEEKPAVVMFTASWCGVCQHFKRTTLPDARVQEALDNVVFIPLDCSDVDAPSVRPLLTHYGITGFPTFMLLREK